MKSERDDRRSALKKPEIKFFFSQEPFVMKYKVCLKSELRVPSMHKLVLQPQAQYIDIRAIILTAMTR